MFNAVVNKPFRLYAVLSGLALGLVGIWALQTLQLVSLQNSAHVQLRFNPGTIFGGMITAVTLCIAAMNMLIWHYAHVRMAEAQARVSTTNTPSGDKKASGAAGSASPPTSAEPKPSVRPMLHERHPRAHAVADTTKRSTAARFARRVCAELLNPLHTVAMTTVTGAFLVCFVVCQASVDAPLRTSLLPGPLVAAVVIVALLMTVGLWLMLRLVKFRVIVPFLLAGSFTGAQFALFASFRVRFAPGSGYEESSWVRAPLHRVAVTCV